MKYLRNQMLFDDSLHYTWDETRHTGLADTERLDRSNGEQVLLFINRFAAEQQLSELEELQEVEFFIRYGTPSSVQSVSEISSLICQKLESRKVPVV